jgi:hypothetical protein
VCTPACLLAASISVEAVTPPLVGLAILKELLQTSDRRLGSQTLDDLQDGSAVTRRLRFAEVAVYRITSQRMLLTFYVILIILARLARASFNEASGHNS